MQAVIDVVEASYIRLLIENGDIITVHKTHLPEEVKLGDVLKVRFELDQESSKRQHELMEQHRKK